jgi:thiosulfate dehydrogenase (quinone) large subunit
MKSRQSFKMSACGHPCGIDARHRRGRGEACRKDRAFDASKHGTGESNGVAIRERDRHGNHMNYRDQTAAPTSAQSESGQQSRSLAAGDYALGYALLRVTLGVNIAMHGIGRILAGVGGFAAGLEKQFAATPLPHFAVSAFGHTLPWAEASIGLLVLFGGATRVALVAGALLMIVLTFGTTLHQDWQVAGLQLIYAIAYGLLIAFHRFNSLSLDRLLSRGKQ